MIEETQNVLHNDLNEKPIKEKENERYLKKEHHLMIFEIISSLMIIILGRLVLRKFIKKDKTPLPFTSIFAEIFGLIFLNCFFRINFSKNVQDLMIYRYILLICILPTIFIIIVGILAIFAMGLK